MPAHLTDRSARSEPCERCDPPRTPSPPPRSLHPQPALPCSGPARARPPLAPPTRGTHSLGRAVLSCRAALRGRRCGGRHAGSPGLLAGSARPAVPPQSPRCRPARPLPRCPPGDGARWGPERERRARRRRPAPARTARAPGGGSGAGPGAAVPPAAAGGAPKGAARERRGRASRWSRDFRREPRSDRILPKSSGKTNPECRLSVSAGHVLCPAKFRASAQKLIKKLSHLFIHFNQVHVAGSELHNSSFSAREAPQGG